MTTPPFDELDAKITKGMKDYAIPGVAVGVWADRQEYIKGFGVTNVDHPLPVDGDTVFRIGSTTKTFTATTMMRLVEQGKVDLDAKVRQYIPDLGAYVGKYVGHEIHQSGKVVQVVVTWGAEANNSSAP
jgi:CubicO group peptidase (beta-lactamase class C family)